MATRSERFRAEAQREARQQHEKAPPAQVEAPHGQAEKKATCVREAPLSPINETHARPSRKSTRKSANRAKPDAALQHAHQVQSSTPEARFARDSQGNNHGGTR
jgi:hypothetical protein